MYQAMDGIPSSRLKALSTHGYSSKHRMRAARELAPKPMRDLAAAEVEPTERRGMLRSESTRKKASDKVKAKRALETLQSLGYDTSMLDKQARRRLLGLGQSSNSVSHSWAEEDCGVETKPNVQDLTGFGSMAADSIAFRPRKLTARKSSTPKSCEMAMDMSPDFACSQTIDEDTSASESDDEDNDDEDESANTKDKPPTSFRISDDRTLVRVYDWIFASMQQLSMKNILKAWIKEIEPKKSRRFPYCQAEKSQPRWWPNDVEHREPDHLKKGPRHALAIAILRYTMTDKFEGRGLERLVESTANVKLQFEKETDDKVARRKRLLDQLYLVARYEYQFRKNEIDGDMWVPLKEPLDKREPSTKKKRKSRPKYTQKSLVYNIDMNQPNTRPFRTDHEQALNLHPPISPEAAIMSMGYQDHALVDRKGDFGPPRHSAAAMYNGFPMPTMSDLPGQQSIMAYNMAYTNPPFTSTSGMPLNSSFEQSMDFTMSTPALTMAPSSTASPTDSSMIHANFEPTAFPLLDSSDYMAPNASRFAQHNAMYRSPSHPRSHFAPSQPFHDPSSWAYGPAVGVDYKFHP